MKSRRPNTFIVKTATCIAIVALVGCDKKSEPKPVLKPTTPADRQQDDAKALSEFLNKDAKPASSGALPQGHPPIAGSTPAPSTTGALPPGHPPMSGATPAPPSGPELKYEVPTEWQPMPVKSPLRKAQYKMPGAAGLEDGEMIVYFFGANQGGPVDANLQRWRGFFTTFEGNPIPDDSVRSERFEVGDMKVTTIDVAGRYADTTMSPDSKPSDKPMRLLGAIVETPGGNWFFKGIGPVETMQNHLSAFGGMLRTVKQ
ncbi:MAG: hypothetical protein IPK83_22705 [Planctomycetes bacterium]|nr:hypothetical protein [Planctomycetota bacterium]